MQSTHDLRRTPSLIDAQVGDEVRTGRGASGGAAEVVGRRIGAETKEPADAKTVGVPPALLDADGARHAVAELSGVGTDDLAGVAGVGRGARSRRCRPPPRSRRSRSTRSPCRSVKPAIWMKPRLKYTPGAEGAVVFAGVSCVQPGSGRCAGCRKRSAGGCPG